jgi:hypothetical protein
MTFLKREDEARLEHHGAATAETSAATLRPQLHGKLSREWAALLFAVVSFVIAQIVIVSLHYRATRLQHQNQEIQLTRDLAREFYLEGNTRLQVANAIESCEKLYKGDGGQFTHNQINDYLGFFTDLGLLLKRGALSLDLIGHYFGAFIVEAYEYPEVQSYIARVRTNFNQPGAFEDFDRVAQAIEKDTRFVKLAQLAKTMCSPKSDESAGP